MKATNILFKNNSGLNPMRLILGMPGCENKREYERAYDEACDAGAEPIVIVRKCEPRVWIEDDTCFILNNMVEGCQDDWPEGLNDWWDEIQSVDREAGEKFVFKEDDLVITATVDDTPMTDLRYLEEGEI